MRRRRAALAVVVALSLPAGCGGGAGAPDADGAGAAAGEAAPGSGPLMPDGTPDGPKVLVLGTAQDGGFPHASCDCRRCETARRDPSRRRRIASLAVLIPSESRVALLDATPDIREQLDALRALMPRPGGEAGRVRRKPLDAVLLTHAHLGHYTGLAFFGFEAVHTRGLPVHASRRMAEFLRGNGPWSQLVALGNLSLEAFEPGAPIPLGGGVTATPLPVPHRDEFSDTVGYLLRGPRGSLLYVPDTDGWDAWPRPIEEVAREADVALLDGTFFSPDELPGRPVSSIGHPLMTDTMDRLEPLVRSGSLRVLFTHMNHSNPALDPAGAERRLVESRGFGVLEEGALFPL